MTAVPHVHDGHAGGHGHTQRHAHEAEVYDARADELLATLTDEELAVDAGHPPYPNREHIAFLDHLLGHLGDLDGMDVLEVGCGQGALATYLALCGARVTALDVSEGNVRLTRRRAEASGVEDRVRAEAIPIETFDAPDASFDAVVGNQVLHHVELDEAITNMHRMLRPGGRIAFCEPVLLLPAVVGRVRDSAAVTRVFPSRKDTPDERAILQSDLVTITRPFEDVSLRAFQVTCRLQNFVELSDPMFSRLERFDGWLLRRLPASRRLSRYVVVLGTRGTVEQPGVRP